jgi:hypothetical protein
MYFCLCGAILNLKAFCFGVIPDIMIRVDSLWECATNKYRNRDTARIVAI